MLENNSISKKRKVKSTKPPFDLPKDTIIPKEITMFIDFDSFLKIGFDENIDIYGVRTEIENQSVNQL